VADVIPKEYEIQPYICQPGTLITARSHLIDRFVPDCEIIMLPEKTVEGGHLSWSLGLAAFPAVPASKLKRILERPKKMTMAPSAGILFDFRFRVPENWAHFLNNHLPVFFFIAGQEGLSPEDCTLVLPSDIPAYILAAAKLFGIRTLCSDASIEGAGITLKASPWKGTRAIRADWISQSPAKSCLEAAQRDGSQTKLPTHVFLSRKDTRRLVNEAETEAFLANRGYVKVYAEDFSVLDQFLLFQGAESIVAVHGAGLAPLLYCSGDAVPKNLIEILPCGHMTDVYRVMAQQIGCDWIGVRGKIKPEHVQPAYKLDTPFRAYSLQSFEVDLKSLERAFEMV